jgi:hypothetical protein
MLNLVSIYLLDLLMDLRETSELDSCLVGTEMFLLLMKVHWSYSGKRMAETGQ